MYGFTGALLLTAGILLHGIPCALLFVKPDDNVSRPCNNHDRITGEINAGFKLEVEENKTAEIKPEVEIKSNSLCKNEKEVKAKKRCAEMFSLSLFKNPKFAAFIGSSFAVNLAFLTPFHLLPDQAIELGMSKSEAAWLASVIGRFKLHTCMCYKATCRFSKC